MDFVRYVTNKGVRQVINLNHIIKVDYDGEVLKYMLTDGEQYTVYQPIAERLFETICSKSRLLLNARPCRTN